MWRRGFLDGIFPAPSGDPAHEDIGVFLLNFFTNNITYVDTMDRRRQEAMEIAFELIKLLIEAQNVYTQIIERRLCAKNAEFAPFQVGVSVVFLNVLRYFIGLKRKTSVHKSNIKY
jgi:hypothetical protein